MAEAPRARRANVLVYAGAGVSAHALAYTLDGLRTELAPALHVVEVTAAALLAGGWEASTGASARLHERAQHTA
jgi:glutamine amidotransferase-like uncharacterized protein